MPFGPPPAPLFLLLSQLHQSDKSVRYDAAKSCNDVTEVVRPKFQLLLKQRSTGRARRLGAFGVRVEVGGGPANRISKRKSHLLSGVAGFLEDARSRAAHDDDKEEATLCEEIGRLAVELS